MGPFSQNCMRCDRPLLSPHKTEEINAWMSEGVVVTPGGEVHTGVYDGYGRLAPDREAATGLAGNGERVVGRGTASTVYHGACWELEGEPADYRGRSPDAPDQGWLFARGAHAVPDPRLQLPEAPRFGIDPATPDASFGDGAGM